jgi:hypothetical protein
MNSKRIFVIGAAAAMSMASFYANATAGHVALEACVDAMVGELSEANGTQVGYRLDSESDNFDRNLRTREVISLYARDPGSDVLVSRMDCVVDQRGRVIRLKDMPLEDDMDKRVTKAD